MKKSTYLVFAGLMGLLAIVLFQNIFEIKQRFGVIASKQFDGERAYQYVLKQLSFGPRYPGSEGHKRQIEWMIDELNRLGWSVEIQEVPYSGTIITNIIGHRNISSEDWILLGAHYDTRQFADQELEINDQLLPVLGANDGASGIAILLEIARILPDTINEHISLVFFDYEDNGGIDGKDWAMGSRVYVESISAYPEAVIIVDMVGDESLQIYLERGSDLALKDAVWGVAEALGYDDTFINQPKYNLIDDHTAFIVAGIPAIDIIDFDYPYWHTLEDTADKVSPQSLQVVGEVLLAWLLEQ